MLSIVLLVVFSYLLGSIPTAYLAGKLKRGIDIRKRGSGNVGATNALVIIGPLVGLLVYIIDLLKGLIPVLIAKRFLGTDLSMGLAGLAAIIGHDYPIFLGFSGGKGVATTTGVMFGLDQRIMWIIVIAWFVVLVPLTNQFILSSLLCMLLIPLLMFTFRLSSTVVIFGCLYFLVGLFAHREDVVRIVKGQSPKAFDMVRQYLKR